MYDNSDLLLLKIESEEILSVVIKVSANSDQFQELAGPRFPQRFCAGDELFSHEFKNYGNGP